MLFLKLGNIDLLILRTVNLIIILDQYFEPANHILHLVLDLNRNQHIQEIKDVMVGIDESPSVMM